MTESGLSEGGYVLVVAFPDQSPSFAHGFEAGKLWERMDLALPHLEETTRVENREVIRRMADHMGYTAHFRPSETEGWDLTTMQKVGPSRRRENPHGLRVVGGDQRC